MFALWVSMLPREMGNSWQDQWYQRPDWLMSS